MVSDTSSAQVRRESTELKVDSRTHCCSNPACRYQGLIVENKMSESNKRREGGRIDYVCHGDSPVISADIFENSPARVKP